MELIYILKFGRYMSETQTCKQYLDHLFRIISWVPATRIWHFRAFLKGLGARIILSLELYYLYVLVDLAKVPSVNDMIWYTLTLYGLEILCWWWNQSMDFNFEPLHSFGPMALIPSMSQNLNISTLQILNYWMSPN
jgi:hypothetical protein